MLLVAWVGSGAVSWMREGDRGEKGGLVPGLLPSGGRSVRLRVPLPPLSPDGPLPTPPCNGVAFPRYGACDKPRTTRSPGMMALLSRSIRGCRYAAGVSGMR